MSFLPSFMSWDIDVPLVLLVLRPAELDWTLPLAVGSQAFELHLPSFVHLQIKDVRSWDFSTSIITRADIL